MATREKIWLPLMNIVSYVGLGVHGHVRMLIEALTMKLGLLVPM